MRAGQEGTHIIHYIGINVCGGGMKDGIRTRDEIGTTVYDCYMPTVNGRPPLSAERHGRRGGVWGSAGGVK